jgi:deoxyribose-phosphate aldolase
MHMNKYIDYIDDPNDSFEQYVEKGKRYDFRCVFADPDQYEEGKRLLEGSDVILAGAVDFPEGKMDVEQQLGEMRVLADLGFEEVDYVLNQSAVEAHDFAYIEREMTDIATFCHEHGMRDKAIVEMCKLGGDEDAKRRICEIALAAKPFCLKTSTGRSWSGAKLEDVRLMRSVLGDKVRIKAAGGIHTYDEAVAFIEAGADILGASAGIAIVEGEHD